MSGAPHLALIPPNSESSSSSALFGASNPKPPVDTFLMGFVGELLDHPPPLLLLLLLLLLLPPLTLSVPLGSTIISPPT